MRIEATTHERLYTVPRAAPKLATLPKYLAVRDRPRQQRLEHYADRARKGLPLFG